MKRHVMHIAILAVVLILAGTAAAELVGGPDIIPAPGSIIDDPPGAVNMAQQAFNEGQSVLLPADLAVDGGVIPAGTLVDSHMIFLNTDGGVTASDFGVEWTFDGPILGVMSDGGGTLEAASSALLGAPGTDYPGPFPARGLEGNNGTGVGGEGYAVDLATITVGMRVSEPGDWIRVVTLAVIDGYVDIKPGSEPNSINLTSKGVLPVALLGSDTVDVLDIDPATAQLGDPALAGAVSPLRWAREDVNGDQTLDLTLFFSMPELVAKGALDGDSIEACLTVETLGGNPVVGCDSVRIVPPKK